MIYIYLFFISLIILLFFYYNKDKRVLIIAFLPFTLHFIKNYMKSHKKKRLEHFDMDKLNLQITKDDLFILPVKNLLPINCCCEEEDVSLLKLDRQVYTCFSNDKCITNNIHRYYWHLFLNNFTVVSKKKIDNYNPFAKYNNLELWHVGTFKTENEAQLYVGSLFNIKLPLESSYHFSGILGLDKDFVKIVKVSDIVPDCLCVNDSDMKSIKDNSTKIDTDLLNFFKNREKLKKNSLDGEWSAPIGWNMRLSGTTNSNKGIAFAYGNNYTATTNDGKTWNFAWNAIPFLHDGGDKLVPTSNPWGIFNRWNPWAPRYNLDKVTLVRQNPSSQINTIKSGTFVSNELCLKYNIYSNYWTQNVNNYAIISYKQFDNYYNFGKHELKPVWHIKTYRNELDAQYYLNKLFNLNKEPDSIKVGDSTFTIIPVSELFPDNCCLNSQGMIALNELNPKLGFKSGCVKSWGGNTPEALQHCIDNNIYINYWSDNALGYAIVSDKKYKDYRNFARYKNIPVWHIETYPEFSKAMVALKTKYNRQITNESSKSYTWQYVENGGKTLFNLDKESGDVQCLSYDGLNCLWGFVDAANDNPTYSKKDPIIPLKCGEQHMKLYNSTGYNDTNHWCAKVYNQLMTNSQEAYDYNDWAVYKTQYINNKKIEPISGSSIDNSITKSSTNKTWNINWTPKIGFINFMKGNDVALHFNIRDNITVFNAWTSSTRSWGAEQNTYDFNNTPRPLNVKVRFNINKFEIVYQDKIISFPNRFNISNAEDITIISDNGITYNVEMLSPEMMASSINKNDPVSKTSQITRVNMGKNFAISLIVNLNAIDPKTWTEVLSITGIKDELPLKDGQINSRILSLVITPNTNLLTVIIGDNKNYTTTAIDMNNKFELPINMDTLIDIVFSKNKFKIYKNNILFSVAPLSIDRTYPNEAFIYSSYVLAPIKGYFRNLVFVSSDGPLTVHDLTLNGVFIDAKNSLIYLFCNNILLLYKFKGNNLEFSEKVNETRFTITNKRKIEIEDKKLLGFEYINPNSITVNNQNLTRYYPKESITINNDSNKTLLRFNNSIYGDIPNQSKLAITNNNFTIEFWYIQFGNEWNNTIIDKGDYEYLVSINPNNQQAIGFYNKNMGWWYVYVNIPVNNWTHIAISYIKTESKLSCLVNGNEINNIKLGVANLHSGIGNVNIGRQSPISCACNLLKNAIIYDLRIWGVARNQPDIANNMLTIQKINSDGLIANFLMDDKKDIIIDRVSGFNATIINYLGISNYSIVPWFPKKTEELIDYNITIFSDGIVSLIDINTKLPIITSLKLWSVDINTQKGCKKYLKEPVVPVIKLTNTEILNISKDSIVKLNNITINFEREYNKLLLPKLTNDEINIIKANLNEIKFIKTDNTNFLFGRNIKNRKNDDDYKYLGDGNSYLDCENLALKDSDINKITSITWFNTVNGENSKNCFGVFNNKSRTNQLSAVSGIKDIKQKEITNQPTEFMINNPIFKTTSDNLQSVLYVSSPLFNIFAGVSKLEVVAKLTTINNASNVAIRLNTVNNSIVGRSESIAIKSGQYIWTIQCINLDSGSYYLDFITTNNEPFNFYGYEINPKLIACEVKQYREYNNLLNVLQQQGIISQQQQSTISQQQPQAQSVISQQQPQAQATISQQQQSQAQAAISQQQQPQAQSVISQQQQQSRVSQQQQQPQAQSAISQQQQSQAQAAISQQQQQSRVSQQQQSQAQATISQQQQTKADEKNSNQQLNINITNLNGNDKNYISSVLKNIIDNHKEQILIELNYNKIIEDLNLKKTKNTIDIKQRDSLLQNIDQMRRLNDPLKINEINNLQNNLTAILDTIDKNTKKIEELNNIIINDKSKIEKTVQLTSINNALIKNIEEKVKTNPNLNFLSSISSNINSINSILQTNIDLNTNIIKQSKIPESKITKISGKFTSNGIEKIQIVDTNNPTVYSGTNDTGEEFSYECPDNGYIIGYDYGINKTNPGSSIFSGIGPIYCSDGTVIKKKIGKGTDTKIGSIPQTIYNKFDYQTNMIRTDDSMGIFKNVNSENCATICSYVDKCKSFSFNDNICTIYNNNSNNNLKKGGKTYNKLN
jgi:hypothetical protein